MGADSSFHTDLTDDLHTLTKDSVRPVLSLLTYRSNLSVFNSCKMESAVSGTRYSASAVFMAPLSMCILR